MRLYELGIYKNGRAMVWMNVSSLWVGMTVVNSWHKYRGTCTVRLITVGVCSFFLQKILLLLTNNRALISKSMLLLWRSHINLPEKYIHRYHSAETVNLEVFAFCMRSFQVLYLELVWRVIEVELYLRIRLTATIALRLYAEDLLIFIRFTVADYV
uniref:Uncharacterized protein n=1 Tax=Glossina palpalis gambiensis TaxID=67801 RepID=A0A1B0B641_9MUSC